MNPATDRLGSQSAFARHRGVSRQMVGIWKKEGRIAMVGELVDFFESDALLARSLDPARGGKGGKSKRAGAPQNPAAVDPNSSAGASGAPAGDEDTPADPQSFQAARARRENFAAKQAELDYRKAVGEVIEADRAGKAFAGICTVVRQAVQRLPDTLASRLAAESDPRKVRAMLAKDLEQALSDMADAVAALPEQLTATQQ